MPSIILPLANNEYIWSPKCCILRLNNCGRNISIWLRNLDGALMNRCSRMYICCLLRIWSSLSSFYTTIYFLIFLLLAEWVFTFHLCVIFKQNNDKLELTINQVAEDPPSVDTAF
jgi:hypothetical protein